MSRQLRHVSLTAPQIAVDRTACPAWVEGRRKSHHHGTEAAEARHGCRCPDASADRRLKQNQRLLGTKAAALVSAVGSIRRIQALEIMGWTTALIGKELGVHGNRVWQIQAGVHDTVTRATHDGIARVYRKLAFTPGPSSRVRARAQRAGYYGPLCWSNIDDPNEKPSKGWTPESDRDKLPDEGVADALLAHGVKWTEVRLIDRPLAAHMILKQMTSFEAGLRLGLDADTIGKAAKKYRGSAPEAA